MKHDETIEFDFNHHSILEIVGETKGVIQFNDFDVLSCQSTVVSTTSSTWPTTTAEDLGVPSKYAH